MFWTAFIHVLVYLVLRYTTGWHCWRLIQGQQKTRTFTFASFDTTNKYSNIPVTQTKHILHNTLHLNHANTKIKSEVLDLYKTITQQNYCRHNDITVTQTDGLAMGAPSSSIISEIFLEHTQHTHLPRKKETQNRELRPVRWWHSGLENGFDFVYV